MNKMINIYKNESYKMFLEKCEKEGIEKHGYILEENITEEIIKRCFNKMMEYELNGESDEYSVIKIGNIKNINESWKNDKCYLSENYENLKNKTKYLRSRIDIFENKISKPPEIGTLSGHVGFVNGRHRFSNFRDLGEEIIPVIIEKEFIEEYKKKGFIM